MSKYVSSDVVGFASILALYGSMDRDTGEIHRLREVVRRGGVVCFK